ncbi:MAG: NAD(P)-dependent oxidoreductase, partial [Candidatus Methanofastidiosa archaeon]|nr:NAD(P)-dependent oxidoreductase [Candidatus Methanofastidiosa archaeon]
EVTGIINVSSGEPISLADKVESFIEDNNFDIKLKYGVFPDRPYDSPAIWGDNQKITEILENQ